MSYQTFIIASVYAGLHVDSFTMDSSVAVLKFSFDGTTIVLSLPASTDRLFERFLHDALEFLI